MSQTHPRAQYEEYREHPQPSQPHLALLPHQCYMYDIMHVFKAIETFTLSEIDPCTPQHLQMLEQYQSILLWKLWVILGVIV